MKSVRSTARPSVRLARTALALGLAGTLVACSAQDSEDSSSDAAPSAPTASSEPGAAGSETTEPDDATDEGDGSGSGSGAGSDDAFCAAYEENGGTGATIGGIQLWLPKEDLVLDLQTRLGVMDGLEPPAEVAEAWSASQAYYVDLQGKVDALPAGGVIDDPAVYGSSSEMTETFSTFTDWYFDTCR